ncbi:hypothetical protein Egran_00859 [Elaphomyces granulatus]|uniref:Heterokaryon incompatibility domain-containing protein n=1 Tax=Elaphomyces granulatus TaxID=519963 RepID=A0A232M4W7_9EURO|nr:hypothetical protein Egran_00859 [Elaphomyces granulatus]
MATSSSLTEDSNNENNVPVRPLYLQTPLAPGSCCIRLVELLPSAKAEDPVRCILRVARLDNDIRYEALSYCWGHTKVTEGIFVNDSPLQVTINLFAALRTLRQNNAVLTLWIDAICIDQENPKEKVVVWLGAKDRHSDEGMNFFHKASQKYTEEKAKGFSGVERANFPLRAMLCTGPDYIYGNRLTLRAFLRSTAEQHFFYALAILRRPWFTRTWIIQEIALATRAIVHCGDTAIEWDSLVNAVQFLEMLHNPLDWSPNILAPHLHFKVLLSTQKEIQAGKRFSFRDALRRFQLFEATEPKDKVFALCALFKQPERIIVDTRCPRPVDRLYRDTAAEIIRETNNLSILLDCHHMSSCARRADLPTWVPDWSASWGHRGGAVSAAFDTDPYYASRFENLDFPNKDSPNKDSPDKDSPPWIKDGCLRVSGCRVDRIKQMGPKLPRIPDYLKKLRPEGQLLPDMDFAYKFIVNYCRAVREWKSLAFYDGPIAPSEHYSTGEMHQEVFWYTFVQPDHSIQDGEAMTRFYSYTRLIKWQLDWFDWFVARVSADEWHWFFIWVLFVHYLQLFGCVSLFHYLMGRLSFNVFPKGPDLNKSGKVIGRTEKGLLGTFPDSTEVGDWVVLLEGASRPLILRPINQNWEFLGSAYIHGIMYGGAFDPKKCEDLYLI